MKKTALIMVLAALALGACASTNNTYNSYDSRSSNERQIDNAISSEMNSLSDRDIAQLNKLK
jgi:uncharacterized lipoprotein YmbA